MVYVLFIFLKKFFNSLKIIERVKLIVAKRPLYCFSERFFSLNVFKKNIGLKSHFLKKSVKKPYALWITRKKPVLLLSRSVSENEAEWFTQYITKRSWAYDFGSRRSAALANAMSYAAAACSSEAKPPAVVEKRVSMQWRMNCRRMESVLQWRMNWRRVLDKA